MELADNVTDDPGRLLVRLVVHIVQFIHCIKNSAVNGLQSVPDIRQSPADYCAHCIIEVRAFHLLFDGNGNYR